jgi:molybdate transport system substrate-binding protein
MKRIGTIAVAVCMVSFALPFLAARTQAADLKLLEGNALNAVMDELGPQFEKMTGNKIDATIGTSAQLKARADNNEAFDAIILTKTLLDQLYTQGKIAASPRVPIAHVGIGVAIRKGAAKPDIATVDAFKQAMLNATSIGYVDNTPTGAALKAIFAKLGIAEQIGPKLKPLNIQAADAVAKGDVEIGMTQISEILPVAGAELVGPLPPDIQVNTVFAGGVSATAKNPQGAAELIKFLAAPVAAAAIRTKGLEPG